MKKMKIVLASLLVFLTVFAFAGIGVKGETGSAEVLEASKKIGVKNSPCALMTVGFSSLSFNGTESIIHTASEYLAKHYLKIVV